jgi:hypothetical protein
LHLADSEAAKASGEKMSMGTSAVMRVAVIAALCGALIGVAKAQVSPQLAQKAPDAAEIAATAAQQGFVRVIVEIAAPGLPTELRPDAEFLASITSQVATLQDAVIAAHFGSATNPSEGQGFSRNLVRFEISPLLAVNVSRAELDALAADPGIVFIQYDRAASPTLLQSVPLVGMGAVYQSGGTGASQAVAVLDTGAQVNHEFLVGNIFKEACFSSGISLCPNKQKREVGPGASNSIIAACMKGSQNLCDHGTHVTGIAAGNNPSPRVGYPANGVAKGAKIISIQVFTRFNTVKDCDPMRRRPSRAPCVKSYDSDQMRALDWLIANAFTWAPDVHLAAVNMSLGGEKHAVDCNVQERLMKARIDALRRVGVPTVAAAGNDEYTNAINAPACISTAIAVGSSDKADKISDFTNMSRQVALMAPGGMGGEQPCAPGTLNPKIYSSVTSSSDNDSYGCNAGTSMAAPHVAGAFATIRTVCRDATIDQILTALKDTGVPVSDTRDGGQFTRPRIQVYAALRQLGCGRAAAATTHDLNGDGKSDLLWRYTAPNMPTTGAAAVWLMNGAEVSSQGAIGARPLSWSIVGQRDFDGDGKYDLLWRDTSGNNAIWLMNGTTVKSQIPFGMVSTTWSVVGTADFAGTGKGGILWRDIAGNAAIWLLNGAQVASQGSLGNIPTTWSVAATADFDGDGKADILWRDTAGDVAIWFMDGTQVVSAKGLGKTDNVWSILGTGDFDGDGRGDIVWRDIGGNLWIWFMNGVTVVSKAGFGVLSTTFSLAQTGDYNGDGMSDLLWQDGAGGTSIWFMSGAQVLAAKTMGAPPTTWTLQSVNAN